MPGVSNGDVQKAYPSVKAAGKAWGIGHDKIYDAIRRGHRWPRRRHRPEHRSYKLCSMRFAHPRWLQSDINVRPHVCKGCVLPPILEENQPTCR